MISMESCVLKERHHASVELLDDVVEVYFGCLLVVAGAFPVSKLRLGVLAEDLELADADLFRKQKTSEAIRSPALGKGPVVPAQPVVIGELAFDRKGAAIEHFLLEEEIGGGGSGAVLHLSRSADGQQILIAIVGGVQVVSVLRIPEIDLDASGPNDFLTRSCGPPIEHT